MEKFKAWLHKIAAPDWRKAHKFWSFQLAIVSSIFYGLWAALPAFQEYMPPTRFAMSCVIVSCAIGISRLIKQNKLHE
jgi:hypothetical protein